MHFRFEKYKRPFPAEHSWNEGSRLLQWVINILKRQFHEAQLVHPEGIAHEISIPTPSRNNTSIMISP